MNKNAKMHEKTGRKCQERGKTRPKLDKRGKGRYILFYKTTPVQPGAGR